MPTRRPTWEPGTLSNAELEVLITDALADLWASSFHYRLAFEARLTDAIYYATGRRATVQLQPQSRREVNK